MIKIILCMIVRNESRIIERCLRNAMPMIDAISICDTGSDDNTVELIKSFCDKNNLKGCVWSDPWKNFGHNRSRSLTYAVKTATELGWDLDKTYALLLDADMNLIIKPTFGKQKLVSDGYLIIQKNSVLTYYNTRFVKLSKPWKCIGVTHEYWGADGAINSKLEDVLIDDVNDGGCKHDKYERDIRLLTQGIEDEPNNERYYFYLAQSYMDAGKVNEGIEWYKKRVEKGGWGEEVFYSLLRIGHGYLRQNEVEKAIFYYLKAHNYRPSRSEAIYEAAHRYRMMGQYHLSYMFAKEGKKIPYPKDDLLFIRHDIYGFLLDFEISISAYYVGGEDKMKEGLEACNKLLSMPEVPENVKQLTHSNIKFYRDKMNIKKDEKVVEEKKIEVTQDVQQRRKKNKNKKR